MPLRPVSRAAFVLIGAVGFALALAACAGDDPAEAEPVVTVFGPYRGEEAQLFRDSVAPFEERTGIDIQYVGAGSVALDLEARLHEADLPDVAILPQPALVRELARSGDLVPLNSATADTVRANYDEAAVELSSVDGTLYSVWYSEAVKSLVWYRPDVFAEFGYEVPKTWSELVDLTVRMEHDGFEPWCLSFESFGASGWVGTDWIEDIVLRLYGPEVYDAWAAGEISFEDARIAEAFAAFDEIALAPGKAHGGPRRILKTPWQEAAHPMFDDPPGCLLHRQMESYRAFLPSGVEFGEDVDVFVLPAMDDGPSPLLVAGELAVSFSDRPEVHDFLTFLATPEASAVWGAEGGHLSPLADLDAELYAENEFARRMAELVAGAEVLRFDASDIMDPRVGTGTFWEGMVNLIRTGDVERILAEIEAGYDNS